MKTTITAADIAAALNGRPSKAGWLCFCPAHDDKRPSLSVTDFNGKTLVCCFAGCAQDEVIEALRDRGVWARQRARKACRAVPRPRGRHGTARLPVTPKTTVDEDAERERIDAARALWKRARPIRRDSIVDRYFRRCRDIAIWLPASAVRHLPYARAGWGVPAVIAAVSIDSARRDENDKAKEIVTAVQLTYLDPKTGAKNKAAPISRQNFGVLGRGAVRLSDPTDGVLGLAEGVEDALSAMELFGVPCWAVLGAQRLDKIDLPDGLRELHLYADNDLAGQRAAERAAEGYARDGLLVKIRTPKRAKDWNAHLVEIKRREMVRECKAMQRAEQNNFPR